MGAKDFLSRGSIGWQAILLIGLLVPALVIATMFGINAMKNPASAQVIPANIKQQISYVVYYPETLADLTVDTASFKYDKPNGLLSFTVQYANTDITFAEQATPENFVDIPEAYEKLIETLNEYSTFSSFHGTVYLTKPKELNGQQSAVMNSKGTLMFVNTTKGSLTNEQWKKLFNNLEVIR